MKNNVLTELGINLNNHNINSDAVDEQLLHHIFKLAYDFGYKDGGCGIYVCPASTLRSLTHKPGGH
ncbi:hypothetical protein [Pseudoalteromonas sp. OOF1S-7]|uniref:hypothetical protein n=1 Tax=Pseudoalteromonas sp. OOF1S-7 TaxID=2917757 RepID=UPI001EF4396D|nr:hypothetical protein [Pseudoalteromonas sp. OOF1S-7]MCG7536616.1 hypothetical protein [Pseudoalteromonas sp. OOF1S-7]